jgi:thymidylate kinase
MADPSRTVPGRVEDAISHTLYGTRVKLQLHSQRPLLIALDGVDGSGKSVQAGLFDKALEEAALRHRVVWTRGGSSAMLQPVLKLGKRLIGGKSASEGYPTPPETPEGTREAGRASRFRQPLVRALWPWLITCELSVSYLARVRWPLLRGEVVVADRYVLSALMELGARLDRPDIARTPAARLLRLTTPVPGRAYWLDVPTEVALARKEGREAPDFLRRQAELLPELAEGSAAVRTDGTQPADAISDRIITETLRGYLDAHRTLLNGLFWANPRPLPEAWMAERGPDSSARSRRAGEAEP